MEKFNASLPPEGTEIPLSGGRVTQGVMRAGDTVRRPVNANSPFIHSVLLHLEKKGVSCVPRYLGQDEKDREILSFLPGTCPPDLGAFTDEQIAAAMNIVRRCHDALLDFPGCSCNAGASGEDSESGNSGNSSNRENTESGAEIAGNTENAGNTGTAGITESVRPEGGCSIRGAKDIKDKDTESGEPAQKNPKDERDKKAIVCHNDLSPCNFLFAGGTAEELPNALIDWDAAAIGAPLDDLAYAAWLWLDLGNEDAEPRQSGERIERMLEAYLLAGSAGAASSPPFRLPDGPEFLSRIRGQMQRVEKAVFPSEEQTNATRRWAASCESWLLAHGEELAAGMEEIRGHLSPSCYSGA